MKQINPHAKKVCDYLAKNNLIYGCKAIRLQMGLL